MRGLIVPSSRPKRIGARRRAARTAVRKPWYKRATTRLLAAAGAIALSVATSVITGVAQKLVDGDSQASSATSPARSAAKIPLVTAAARVLEDLDQDIWVAGSPVELTPARIARIQQARNRGGTQGDLHDYLSSMAQVGAVKSDGIAIDLNLATRAASQVRVDRIRLASQCRDPLAGTVFYSPPAGPAMPIGKIGFDLDSPAPVARKLVDGDSGQQLGADYFADNVQYLKKDDGFAYRVVARTSKHYCEFRILVDASADGVSQTTTVDDQGRPFRVSALVCGDGPVPCPRFSAYRRVYSGGVANADGNGSWTAKDPKTYNGL
ncbi:hypothetical protein [Actinoallomurus iriomotensis]|uniref:hypothetical protein n=1 Tax=Actinoallomurus iriomotensis TaxID=478107 RepID=UPI002556E982|nr:hypothetical protein [Actinoallomurus iriomotensis]